MDARTFSDESYARGTFDPYVVAQVADTADLNWFYDVVTTLRRESSELKYGIVRKHWKRLSRDMQRAIRDGIRDALVVIVDASLAVSDEQRRRLDFDVTGPMPSVEDLLLNWFPVERPPWFGGVRLFPAGSVRDHLGKRPNIIAFAARSHAAFFDVIDRTSRREAVKRFIQQARYLLPGVVESFVYEPVLLPIRVYDEGNSLATGVIHETRVRLFDQLDRGRGLILPPKVSRVEEVASHQSPHVQAADVAAGFARYLYRQVDGLKKVRDAFRIVVLNGTVLDTSR